MEALLEVRRLSINLAKNEMSKFHKPVEEIRVLLKSADEKATPHEIKEIFQKIEQHCQALNDLNKDIIQELKRGDVKIKKTIEENSPG